MLDLVYVKSTLLYHGGTLFRRSVNHPDQLVKTILAFMLKCLFGGPKFITKMLPVTKLDAGFQHSLCVRIIENVKEQQHATVLAVIADENRVNQTFFQTFKTVRGKPWLCEDNMFLPYDYVHILKYIRNNWLTEKCRELEFEYNGKVQVARWKDISDLFLLESKSLVKLSKLNAIAVSPKPVEQQIVSTCLRVFSDETISALETHPNTGQEKIQGTIQFLKIIVSFWKIVNVNSIGADIRYKDDLHGVILSLDENSLANCRCQTN